MSYDPKWWPLLPCSEAGCGRLRRVGDLCAYHHGRKAAREFTDRVRRDEAADSGHASLAALTVTATLALVGAIALSPLAPTAATRRPSTPSPFGLSARSIATAPAKRRPPTHGAAGPPPYGSGRWWTSQGARSHPPSTTPTGGTHDRHR